MYYQSVIVNNKENKFISLIEILNLLKIDTLKVAKELGINILLDTEKKSIGIKEVNEVQSWNSLKSDLLKICVINNAEVLTNEAQNSLLKILEEPSENTLVVLVASSLNNLLNTIKSRCFIISSDSQLATIDDDEIIKIVNYNFLERQKYFEDISANSNRKLINALIEGLFNYISHHIQTSNSEVNEITKTLQDIYLANNKSVNIKLVLDNLNMCINQLLIIKK